MPETRDLKPIVPKSYGGKWIAWNRSQTEIVASGLTWREVYDAATALGEKDPVFEKVPRSDAKFLGGIRW